MNSKNILHINSSGRYEGSITRQVSDLVVKYLQEQSPSINSHQRDVATGLPFVNEAWIGANFTAPNERTDSQTEILAFSNELVAELQNAEQVVIATPLYNFGIPAVLKAWVDLIARAQLTFRYNEQGQPEGLLNNKKAIIVMASGGTPIGSDWDTASPYLKQALGFIGISDVTIIDANEIYADIDNSTQLIEKLVS